MNGRHPTIKAVRLGFDRTAAVAVLIALTAPVLIMFVGMGVELMSWVATRTTLQRTADVAALAGAVSFSETRTALTAANAAADIAEINGAVGALARVWNPTTQTLADNQVSIQVGAGVRNSQDTGVTVTMVQSVPTILIRVLTQMTSVTLKATSSADAGLQPCLLALSTSGTGVASQGTSGITLTNCSVRSNSTISAGGTSAQSASAFYATGSINGTETGGPLYPNSAVVADPFAHFAPIQNAFAQLSPNAGTAVNSSGSAVLSPGTYSSWTMSGGTVTLNPGRYYVNGNINLSGQTQLSGAGVTIITSGQINISGQVQITLSAAAFDATSGAIPGMAFAGNSTAPSSMSGGSAATITGAVYYPNGTLSFAGGSELGKQCLELVAGNINLTGNSTMSSGGCSGYGSPAFGSMPRALVALVK